MPHTILLYQRSQDKSTRTWYEYASVPEAVNGLCSVFERELRIQKGVKDVTYDTSDLFRYVDALADLACLVYRSDSQSYQPRDKEWIKRVCMDELRKKMGSN